jgi:hypothetical protein
VVLFKWLLESAPETTFSFLLGFEDNRVPVTYRDHDGSKCGKPFVGRQMDNSAKLGTNGSVKSAAAMTQARAAATRLQTLSQVFVSALNVAQAAFYA